MELLLKMRKLTHKYENRLKMVNFPIRIVETEVETLKIYLLETFQGFLIKYGDLN